MGDITPVLAILTVFGSISFLVWVVVDGLRRKQQLRVMSEFHNKLLDRINNGKDLADFMDSPGGTKFIDSISTERTHPASGSSGPSRSASCFVPPASAAGWSDGRARSSTATLLRGSSSSASCC